LAAVTGKNLRGEQTVKHISVITGGGSGIGLAAAKYIGTTNHVIVVGRTVSKLEAAIEELKGLGISAESFPCDTSNRESVRKLAEYAASCGTVKSVVHAAGMSPHMAGAEMLFRVNAMSCIYINEEFAKVMDPGGCIIDISSMSAYMMPEEHLPVADYNLSLTDAQAFEETILARLKQVPENMAANFAYAISKNFIVWYAKRSSYLCGKKGIRVLSVSPGTFATPMGDLEGEEAAGIAKQGSLGRIGDPEEIAVLLNFLVSKAASYLTGTDILCDGGAIAGMLYAQGGR
jgi:NAD(P)-dependent dehydrogenase (short-subunit alcohol dehydrogenase family)